MTFSADGFGEPRNSPRFTEAHSVKLVNFNVFGCQPEGDATEQRIQEDFAVC